MNTQRHRFIDYVTNGGAEPYVSLQLGAGAGFDCKLTGKEWLSDGTIEDTIHAYELVGCDPLFNIMLPEFGEAINELRWVENTNRTTEARTTSRVLETPYGVLRWELKEQKFHGTTPTSYPLTAETDSAFDILKWYCEQMVRGQAYVGDLLGPTLDSLRSKGAISVQWNLQPFELFGLLSVENLVLLVMTQPDQYRQVCDLIRLVNTELIKEVFKGGADFVFLGCPGSEMLSPSLYDDFIIPDSEILSAEVHDAGGLVYSHVCSPVEPFLSKGYYNRMGIDLFETLSPPPVGNVNDLNYARKILHPNMCTRGNIGLDVLLQGSTEQIEAATLGVLEATRGFKHIVAASDYLFYGIPLENAKTVIRTVSEYAKGGAAS